MTLPKGEMLQRKILTRCVDIAKQCQQGPVKLCLGTNNECVTFSSTRDATLLHVEHEGQYWPIIRGVAAAAVYVFGINSKVSMRTTNRGGRIPYEGDVVSEASNELKLTFKCQDANYLVAYFYHIHLLFRGTRYAYSTVRSDVGNQLKETKRMNQHIQADAYDYALVKRVVEQGFYD